MINQDELIALANLCRDFEDKYLKPTKAYVEGLKVRYGESPTQKQQDEIAVAQNKANDIELLLYLTRKSNGWLAAMTFHVEQLNKLNSEKKIIKNGQLNLLFDEQKQGLLEILNKLLAFVKDE